MNSERRFDELWHLCGLSYGFAVSFKFPVNFLHFIFILTESIVSLGD